MLPGVITILLGVLLIVGSWRHSWERFAARLAVVLPGDWRPKWGRFLNRAYLVIGAWFVIVGIVLLIQS